MTYWLNDSFWMCGKHVPSARIPALHEKCWYGCGTVRPPFSVKVEPKRTSPPITTPRAHRAPPVIVSPPPVVVVPPLKAKPPVLVRVASDEEPSSQERRRGATQKVACLECGKTLWRRPKDVTAGAEFFCCTAHRADYRKTA